MTNQNFLNSNYINKFQPQIEVLDQSQTVFFNTCFDKNQLKTLIGWFLEKYGEKITVDFLETLKQVGFHQATLAGVSLGIDDLQIPHQKSILLSEALIKIGELTNATKTGNITSVEKSQCLIDTWNQTSEFLRQTAVQNFRQTNPVNPVFMMAFSGARGNISQVRQLVAMRGLMADPQGAILEFPIQSNFREGLTITEYLISCYGARKGLVDTALRTATSGYLTRRLVDAAQHVVVVITDCKTKKGILLKNNNLEDRLVGRVLLEDMVLNSTSVIKKNTLLSQKLAKRLALKYTEIFVRSPLTCNTEQSVCQLCYGLNLAQGKLVSLGEAVGVIAAQSIGEPGTQLTMRTFHTGGVGVFSDQAMKSFTAPFDGKVHFVENLPGLFVRTSHGHIVYLLKYSENQNKLTKPILTIKSSLDPSNHYRGSEVFEIDQNAVPSGSLLWVKQGEYVKTGQLLVQASQIKTSQQEMPESSHPVQAPYSGEVFFQSMVIRVITKLITEEIKKVSTTKEVISPKFRTLTQLGNFWLFSSWVQKESSIAKSFFVTGDLVSSDTPVFQYNLTIPKRGQLKRINLNLVLGTNYFDFLFSKISYSKLFYFVTQTDFKNQNTLLVVTLHPTKTLLTWYPGLPNLTGKQSGQCSLIWNFADLVSQKGSDFIDRTSNERLTQKFSIFNGICFFWSQHQVFEFQHFHGFFYENAPFFSLKLPFVEKKRRTSSFLINTVPGILSKKGFFQIQIQQKINWSSKTLSSISLLKNFSSFSFSKTKFLRKRPTSFLRKRKRTTSTKTSSKSAKFCSKIGFSNFLKTALNFSQILVFTTSKTHLINKKQGWLVLPEKQMTLADESKVKLNSSQLNSVLLGPGKNFQKISFLNSFVSVNFLQTKNLLFFNSKESKRENFIFYSITTLVNSTLCFKVENKLKTPCGLSWNDNFDSNSGGAPEQFHKNEIFVNGIKTQLLVFPKQISSQFCFYTMLFDFNSNQQTLKFQLKRKRELLDILFFQKNSQHFLPTLHFFKQKWYLQKKVPQIFSMKSPLCTKQHSTSFSQKVIPQPFFQIRTPLFSDWVLAQNFLKIHFSLKTGACNPQSQVPKTQFNFQLYSSRAKSFFPGFQFLFYNVLTIQNSTQFSFKSFDNGWVVPEFRITEAFFKCKKLGEFGQLQITQKSTVFSVLRNTDLITLKFPTSNFVFPTQTENEVDLFLKNEVFETNFVFEKEKKTEKAPVQPLKIGAILRWGQEIFPGFASPLSGQIVKLTANKLTVRRGFPILSSARGVVHVFNNDLIQKHDLLITLKSRRLQTEDIVQGIPKIEQLFEARETKGGEILPNSAQIKLQTFFWKAVQSKPLKKAVNQSIHQIQLFLVDTILEAYSNQGVKISEKHVEILVRQMTSRVRILSGGDTGLLPGEIVQLKWVERINHEIACSGSRQANYEPLILGITKSVLQSESFLVAASFQEVSRVLVRSALAKKTDFLRGLHENVILGQLLPAGTGIISRKFFQETTALDLQKGEGVDPE